MNRETNITKKKRPLKKTILRIFILFLILLTGASVFIYINFNRLLTNALHKSFNANHISNVYELKFEKLSVNVFTGNVSVYNVTLHPFAKPIHNYPYINSSFKLDAVSMVLKNVELMTLLRHNKLVLKKIELIEPAIDFKIADVVPVFFPLKDTTDVISDKSKKKFIESFTLEKFNMVNAAFHVTNTAKEREFNIKKINISLSDMNFEQQLARDVFSYTHFDFSIGELTGSLQKKAIRHISLKDLKIQIDSLRIVKTIDNINYRFADFSTGLKALDIQTSDSLIHLTMGSFDLSYKDRSITLSDIAYKPNVSDEVLQAKYIFQNTQFSGKVGTLSIKGLNFDSLIYSKKIFIEEVSLDKVFAMLFKDKTKPIDPNKFPEYLGQTIKSIGLPLLVKQVKLTNANLVNRERNPNGSISIANINQATINAKNITNLSPATMLELSGSAYIENKAHFNIALNFSYNKPQFGFSGQIEKFNLVGINPLIESYTPASIKKGIVDEITFSGTAYHTNSTGTLKFLYHDLDISLELENKAKWKSSVLEFAANTVLPAANPASADMPARVVTFHAERDMHKSFVNLTIKSILAGLKETVIMSKENKKAFKKEKKEAKKEAKQEKKEAKKKAKEDRKKDKQ